MRSWSERSPEVANLLNPAFCGEILRQTMAGYFRESRQPLPFSLLFLVLPVILHEATRETMPSTTRTSMHDWLANNPQVRVGFTERANQLRSVAAESLSFLMQLRAVEIDAESGDGSGFRARASNGADIDEIAAAILETYFKKARHLGVWLARAGDPTNVYVMLGVRP